MDELFLMWFDDNYPVEAWDVENQVDYDSAFFKYVSREQLKELVKELVYEGWKAHKSYMLSKLK